MDPTVLAAKVLLYYLLSLEITDRFKIITLDQDASTLMMDIPHEILTSPFRGRGEIPLWHIDRA